MLKNIVYNKTHEAELSYGDRAAGWVSFGQTISGYCAPNVVGDSKLEALILQEGHSKTQRKPMHINYRKKLPICAVTGENS